MESIAQALGMELWLAIVGVLVGLTAFDDAIAAVVSRVPVVGPILAPIFRRLSARFRDWLRTRVPASAEDAVQRVEGHIGDGNGAIKKEQAMEELKMAEPGLTETELEREIQAAFDRMVGAKRLEDQATRTTPQVTP
jgi:hypothetical protein